ncbi:MAG: hypothetical protein IPK93_01940 [Solirubrobacterales bacterium]|nr:hypothetical protein [Solirubrobacterales bacterium]
MTTPPKLSTSAVFAEMRDRTRENRKVLIQVTLLFAVLTSAVVVLELGGTAGFAVSLGLSILLGAAYRGMVSALICLPGPFESVSQLWQVVRPVLARLVWASLLLVLGVGLGVIALVVPALILLTIWSVVIPAIVTEDLSVFGGFGRSPTLVRGNGWRVFAVVMLLGLAAGVVLLVIYRATFPLGTEILGTVVFQFLVACLIFPIAAIGPAALYNLLTTEPEDSPLEDPSQESL